MANRKVVYGMDVETDTLPGKRPGATVYRITTDADGIWVEVVAFFNDADVAHQFCDAWNGKDTG